MSKITVLYYRFYKLMVFNKFYSNESRNLKIRQIFCLVLGDVIETTFPVVIDKNMTVAHLKELIKQEIAPHYNNIPAYKFDLLKVDIPISKENLYKKIDVENINEYENENLLLNITMKEVFYEGLENNNIRIIIKPPDPEESDEGRDGLMVISPIRLKQIVECVESNKITLLRGPPSSGKTTLGQMLRDHFEALKHISIYISLAGISGGPEIYDVKLFDDYWMNEVGFSWTEISECKDIVYVFIDEIQVIYGNGAPFFWGDLKKLSSSSPDFNIPESVQKAIFNITGGHPGLYRFILTALRNQFHENGRTADMLRFLASSSLWDCILGNARAFHWICDWSITKEESEFIRRKILYYQNNVPFSADYAVSPVVKKFIKIGLFSTIGPNEQIQFTAPIMRVILSHYLFTAPLNFESLPARTFDEFLLRTIERMNPDNLRQLLGKGCDNDSYLYERSWQMEWYRTAVSVVPAGTSISADVGAVFGSVGFLDFYINGELCWGVELTREGNRLNEHAERFETNDTYADIPLKQWAIL
ncbi:1962_t:CDS:2 [Dentiscutata erythropus]|uniref:1962_t:CDS:1 n=1 Tax=Dentiscutata erythropus TaxID=1348616 RepID=A0A9N9GEK2_9GLOM|nr:1962_t:CDS:2 [Dentiscutata erythropus]